LEGEHRLIQEGQTMNIPTSLQRAAHPPRKSPGQSSRLETLEPRQLLAATAFISEVNPSGSGSSYAADWFELTNPGHSDLDITGWKMDDNSNVFANAVALRGVTNIPAGKSAIFFEGNATGTTDATILAAFSNAWFGASTPPTGVLIGAYGGTSVGLSGTADAVNIFDAAGNRVTGVSFGAATASRTFDNLAGLGSKTLPLTTVTALSLAGVNGAFLSANGAETGSPGRTMTGVDLSNYSRIGRFDLPEPTRTTPPPNSLLAQEVSAVTYNWDTDTLFVVGDGSTSVVQVSKTGQLIDSMTLASGTSSQGTEFFDTEGLTYIGGGKFVIVEERDRQVNLFTYVPGATLTRADVKTVDLGTFVNNIGIEGISYDPQTGGYIVAKETQPEGIFQTTLDFDAGTASNGSPDTEESINLFDPALAGLLDFADVFALSNIPTLNGFVDSSHILLLSQESGRIVNIDRSGNVSSALTIVSDPGNPLDIPGQQHEGLTMDANGFLYVVSENGGGDFDPPQLWVYAPSSVPNQAPAALALANQVTSIAENTNTVARLKVADLVITDDGLGNNNLSVSGPDASFFEVDSNGLYIKAGTTLDFETKSSYSVTVAVDDPTLGATPDATVSYTLRVTDVINEDPGHPSLFISEVAAWGNNSPVGADWFEVTNNGNKAADITGWKMDDNSGLFSSAVALNGIATIAPGESVIFIETDDLPTKAALFLSTWFGSNAPAGLQIGSYSGTSVGLGGGGDAVNLFDGTGLLQASVIFGASPTGTLATFNNAAALNNATISTLSAVGVNGAFKAAGDSNEIGSPGTVGKLYISEVAPWSSGSAVGADWFEITNTTAADIDITGWKIDDASGSFAAAVPMAGIATIASGESVIFMETIDLAAKAPLFLTNWFSAFPPAHLQIGSYSGGSVGLSTGGDAVNLYNSLGALMASVNFGTSTIAAPFETFDNAAALNNVTISQLSAVGVNGAFAAFGDKDQFGSPGTINNSAPVAESDNIVTAEDTPLTFNVLANDTDADMDTLTITANTAVTHGALASNGTGSFTYTPASNFNGSDSFTYTITDSKGSISTATVNITISAVNDGPALSVPAAQSTPEDIAVNIKGITVADLDVNEGTGAMKITLSVNSGKLTIPTSITGGLTAAQITGNGTKAVVLQGAIASINATLAAGVSYLGNLNFNGNDILNIAANDLGNTGTGGALTDSKTVSIHVSSASEQIGKLLDMVDAMDSQATLSPGLGKSLFKKLVSAQSDVSGGRTKLAYNTVSAFKSQLLSLLGTGVLTSQQAQPLLSAADLLLQSLQIGGGF